VDALHLAQQIPAQQTKNLLRLEVWATAHRREAELTGEADEPDIGGLSSC
jgi:hypothetical protein